MNFKCGVCAGLRYIQLKSHSGSPAQQSTFVITYCVRNRNFSGFYRLNWRCVRKTTTDERWQRRWRKQTEKAMIDWRRKKIDRQIFKWIVYISSLNANDRNRFRMKRTFVDRSARDFVFRVRRKRRRRSYGVHYQFDADSRFHRIFHRTSAIDQWCNFELNGELNARKANRKIPFHSSFFFFPANTLSTIRRIDFPWKLNSFCATLCLVEWKWTRDEKR